MRGKEGRRGREKVRQREKREKGRGGVFYLYKCIHSKISKEQWPARAKLVWGPGTRILERSETKVPPSRKHWKGSDFDSFYKI